MKNLYSTRIGIIGLGYVGLPLAIEFAKKYKTIGYDINSNRVNELKDNIDSTNEVENHEIKSNQISDLKSFKTVKNGFFITSSEKDLEECNFYIVTVPTPVNSQNKPDISLLKNASKLVANFLKKGDIVVYESTVYPGATEEDCVPILSKISGLIYNKDFFVGYSPERINPGDKLRTVSKILKITSGSTNKSADFINEIYSSIIDAGTYKASSIKVAEAAKVIENTQRDINIAFINELAKIFNLLEIDTNEVLDAASTKWNFLDFRPGLVGGHCIGVDPFYLAQKAIQAGYNPRMILAGREINDSMSRYVSSKVIKIMSKRNIVSARADVLILGLTFKENCPDTRNSKIFDMILSLKKSSVNVFVYDPYIDEFNKFDFKILHKHELDKMKFDSVILAVGHNEFIKLDYDKLLKNNNSFIFDIKNFVDSRFKNLYKL